MMMKYRVAAAVALALSLGAGVASADQAVATAGQDMQKFSQEGSKAFRQIELARLAIFNGNPGTATDLVKQAQASMTKAQAEQLAFTKAESELKSSPSEKNPPVTMQGAIKWLPIGGDISITDDYSKDPAKAKAVADANKHLKEGHRDQALQTLKLADVNLSYTLAVVPLDATVADIDSANKLLSEGKYYEANLALRDVQTHVRFDWLDINATPKNGTAKPAASEASKGAAQ